MCDAEDNGRKECEYKGRAKVGELNSHCFATDEFFADR